MAQDCQLLCALHIENSEHDSFHRQYIECKYYRNSLKAQPIRLRISPYHCVFDAISQKNTSNFSQFPCNYEQICCSTKTLFNAQRNHVQKFFTQSYTIAHETRLDLKCEQIATASKSCVMIVTKRYKNCSILILFASFRFFFFFLPSFFFSRSVSL